MEHFYFITKSFCFFTNLCFSEWEKKKKYEMVSPVSVCFLSKGIFFNCQHCGFVWGFLLCLSIRQYYKPFLQDDRHKHILPFYPLKNCWHLWKQYCPTLRHFPATWRHYLTVQHQPYNSTLLLVSFPSQLKGLHSSTELYVQRMI